MESFSTRGTLISEERLFVSVPNPVGLETAGADRAAAEIEAIAKEFGAIVVEDVQYQLEVMPDIVRFTAESNEEASLSDVLSLIGADRVHQRAIGRGVSIAIVDTGVDGSHGEFPSARRKGGWAPTGEDPWTDWNGHGTMCMTIAAASKSAQRDFVGVAPGAGLYACRTHFFDSELSAIYDFLTVRAKSGEKIVASNSFGVRTGTPPSPDPHSDFLPALDDAIAAGVFVSFSAGNYHDLAGGSANGCSPTSIWLHKCRSDVMTVATCDLERRMWYYSSRGEGQYAGAPGTAPKPDVTAPTPRNGRILYGPKERVLADGWGTSGACPQVAGLAALMWEISPDMVPSDLRQAMAKTAVDMGFSYDCQGSGMIDCSGAAVSALIA